MSRGPIVVVAGEADTEARALCARLPGLDLRLMTPADLSRGGWEFRPFAAGGTAVADGEELATDDICAALVRLPWVSEHDLPRIDAADRAYASAEMTAFLTAWLSSLRCPVLNRPTTTCLAGPLWRPERWARLAASIGLPVEPVRRRAGTGPRPGRPAVLAPGAVVATVAGSRCIGVDEPAVAARLVRLARMAGASVLTVHLSGGDRAGRLLAASPWPDLSVDDVLDAVLGLAGVGAPEARLAAVS